MDEANLVDIKPDIAQLVSKQILLDVVNLGDIKPYLAQLDSDLGGTYYENSFGGAYESHGGYYEINLDDEIGRKPFDTKEFFLDVAQEDSTTQVNQKMPVIKSEFSTDEISDSIPKKFSDLKDVITIELKPDVSYAVGSMARTEEKKAEHAFSLVGHDHSYCIRTRQSAIECVKCWRFFASAELLDDHIKCSHSDDYYPCECVCGEILSSHLYLEKHVIEHSRKYALECDFCGCLCSGKRILARHLKIHFSFDLFRWRRTRRKRKRGRRRVKANRRKSYACNERGKLCVTKSELKRHLSIHGEKGHFCPICCRAFFNEHSLKSHMKCHEEGTNKCADCGKVFKLESSLVRHRVDKHDSSKTKRKSTLNKCKICSRMIWNMAIHMLSHTKDKAHECSECGRKFLMRGTLARHMLSHTKDKPYECSTCGKHFADAASVRRHSRIHTGELPFQCNACGRNFRDNQSMRRHLLLHTEEKPFACSQCGKRFTNRSYLKDHFVTHTRGGRLECWVCLEKPRCLKTLRAHLRTHTLEELQKDSG